MLSALGHPCWGDLQVKMGRPKTLRLWIWQMCTGWLPAPSGISRLPTVFPNEQLCGEPESLSKTRLIHPISCIEVVCCSLDPLLSMSVCVHGSRPPLSFTSPCPRQTTRTTVPICSDYLVQCLASSQGKLWRGPAVMASAGGSGIPGMLVKLRWAFLRK